MKSGVARRNLAKRLISLVVVIIVCVTPLAQHAIPAAAQSAKVVVPKGKFMPDGYESGQIVVQLKETADRFALAARYDAQVIGWLPQVRIALLQNVTVPDIAPILDQIRQDSDVNWAEFNAIQKLPEAREAINFSTPLPSDVSPDWGYGLTGAEDISCVNGTGIVVALVDTGIDPTHPDFKGVISADGYNTLDNSTDYQETKDGIDEDGDGIVDGMYGHGTHVAGIVHKVAPGATLLPIKALNDEGIGDSFSVTTAIVYATDHYANVINLSLSSPVASKAIAVSVNYARDHGVALVAATGNDNTDTPLQYPAAFSGVISVAATGPDDKKSPFSNYGSDIVISAPGTGIQSDLPNDKVGVASGTSMAAPFVSGGIALLLQRYPGLTGDQARDILENSSASINQENPDYLNELGKGRLDIYKAVSCGS